MSKRPLLFSSVFASTLAFAGVASAQQAPSNCPPGSWFCANAQHAPAAPPGQPVQVQVIQEAPPPPPPPPPPGRGPVYVYGGAPQPPVVVYQPPPPVVVYQQPRYYAPPPPPVYYYRPKPYVKRNEWGLNLHVEGAALGQSKLARHDSGMGGVGAALRYKPVPSFGLEADIDFLGGRDYNGFQRDETAFTLNGLVFLNPRSRAQVYLLAGFGWSGAHVDDDSLGYTTHSYDYAYFGGQGGLGLEFKLTKHFAISADALGFIRGRIDSGADQHPEFISQASNGGIQTTNTSAGVLFRGGLTFYF